MELQEQFDHAVSRAKDLPQRPSNDELLTLYALFKQASDGDATGDRPGGFDFKATAKFDAWVEKKGLAKEAAMKEYVDLVDQLFKKYS
jgi:acyl-CoA-binding protein